MDSKKIVIDGSNVAYEERSHGKPRVSNIVRMRQELERLGYSPTVIIDATLRHEIDDPEQLEGLLDSGAIFQAPAGAEADYFVIETARKEDAIILSNDTFEPYVDEDPWVEDRRVPYMIIHGEIQIHMPDLDEGRR